jgi:hypothetical protein
MRKKAALFVLLTAVGLMLAGCGPCGFFWDDWRSPQGCRAEPAPK